MKYAIILTDENKEKTVIYPFDEFDDIKQFQEKKFYGQGEIVVINIIHPFEVV